MKVQKAKHQDVFFTTASGTYIKLLWDGHEYRAYKLLDDGRFEDLRLGSVLPEHLKEYILRKEAL